MSMSTGKEISTSGGESVGINTMCSVTPCPSGRNKRNVPGLGSFASPLLRSVLSPVVQTPGNITTGSSNMVTRVTINDDEAERRQRRLESHMRTMLSPGCHTPKSTTATMDSNRVRTMETSTTALTNAQLAEHYSNCIKLSSENKINARNAFGLHLIDYMLEVLRKRGEMTNFQIAGCTLDAGAKIYAGRVDSIYNDAYKMLGGLGRGETQGAGDEHERDESAGNNDTVENRRRTKKSNVHTSQTTERNTKVLDINSFDLEFEVDPLFQKTSAVFDEGGVEGLLLNHLCIQDDSCALMLDAKEVPRSTDTSVQAESISMEELSGQLDLAHFRGLQICPTFLSFRFSEWNSEQSSENPWSIDHILSDMDAPASSMAHKYCNQSDADYSMLQCPPVADNTVMQDYDDEGTDGADLNFAGEEELVAQQETEVGFGEVTSLGTCGDTQVARVVLPESANQIERAINNVPGAGVRELCLSEALEPSEYSYFNTAVTSTWAGPHHWKLRSRNSITHKEEKIPSGKPRKKREPKKQFRVDFWQTSEEKQFTKSKAATKLTKTTLEKLSVEQTTLPKDVHTGIDILFKLFNRPQWKVWRKMTALGTLEENPDGVWYDYGNPNDVNYCPAVNEDDGDSDGLPDGPDTTVQPLGETVMDFYNQSQSFNSTLGPPSQNQVSQEFLVLAGDNLVAQPRRVHQIQIDYARSAKRLDVKRLKAKMWQIITESIPDNKENIVPCENIPIDVTGDVIKSHANGTEFSRLYSVLSTRVSSVTAKNLSVPISFVCLLHLANEKPAKDFIDAWDHMMRLFGRA